MEDIGSMGEELWTVDSVSSGCALILQVSGMASVCQEGAHPSILVCVKDPAIELL